MKNNLILEKYLNQHKNKIKIQNKKVMMIIKYKLLKYRNR